MESHLLQMRGLKHRDAAVFKLQQDVASFTDAWIETQGHQGTGANQRSHLLQMRGLKHDKSTTLVKYYQSHLLQMRGLKPKLGSLTNS